MEQGGIRLNSTMPAVLGQERKAIQNPVALAHERGFHAIPGYQAPCWVLRRWASSLPGRGGIWLGLKDE